MSPAPPPPRPQPIITSPWLTTLPPPLPAVAAPFFAVAKRARSVRLPPIPPHPRGRTIRLARVNIIHGVSGSGRTSLSRLIEAGAGHLREMPAITPASVDVGRLSGGERIVLTGLLLLDALPADGCLLIDDALEDLDGDNFDRFFAALVASGEQVVIAVKSRDVERLREAVGRSCRFVDIADPRPRLGAGASRRRRR